MTDTNRGRRSLRIIMSLVAVALFGSIFISESPSYSSWALIMLWAVPCAFGVVIALGMLLLRRGGSRPVRSNRDPFNEDTSTGIINMARIRVAGFGGLGMVVVAIAMAIVYPRIGQTLLIGLGGGIAAAGLVILYRRHFGPLASGDDGIGGRSVLVEPDDDDEPTPAPVRDRQSRRASPHVRSPA